MSEAQTESEELVNSVLPQVERMLIEHGEFNPFGGAMTMGSLSPFIVVPVFIIIIERAFIVKEEAFLEERFGNEYLEYKKKVKRWF